MADDDSLDDSLTLHLPGSLGVDALLAALRSKEELEYRLTGAQVNPNTGENYFEFTSTIDDDPDLPEGQAGDPDTFLKLHSFTCSPADSAACAACRQDFDDFGGGEVVLDGFIKLASATTYVVFYRGADAEFPQPHVESPAAPPLPFIPPDARRAFDPEGALADIPLRQASTAHLSLRGLKDSVISYFQDDQGKVDAFMMFTDANIDTDGPGGSRHNDPWYGPETSLQFPNDGGSCNSRKFPGVVRSVKLRNQFQLKLGDFAYIYHQGKAVACQIYDQGEDGKIGEISIYAARQANVVSPEMSEADAATKGNDVHDLITLCFPGSCPEHRALPIEKINARAQECLEKFVARLKGEGTMPVDVPPALILVSNGAPTAASGAGSAPVIYPRAAWKALRPKVAKFATEPAQGIVIHNTQDANRAPLGNSGAEKQMAFALSRRIQHSHMIDRGWWDIGQHFTISRGGVIMEARAGSLDAATEGQVVNGAHAGVKQYNRSWWGIEIEGDFRVDPSQITEQQVTALETLCRWLAGRIPRFDPALHVKVHKEVKPNGTDCPGLLLNPRDPHDFITRFREKLSGAGGGIMV